MITVAIPTYNGSRFIEKALTSIIRQTVPISRITLIDDASSDDTVSIARRFADENKLVNFEIIVNQVNIGYQQNWNKCLNSCCTKHLIILHQDDILRLNAVEMLLNAFRSYPDIALAGGHEEFCDADGIPLRQSYYHKATRLFKKGEIYEFIKEADSYIPCSSIMYEIEKIRGVGNFENGVSAADELFWPRVLQKFPLIVLSDPIIWRGSHSGQAEYNSFINDSGKAIAIYEKFTTMASLETRPGMNEKIKHLIRQKFFKGYIGGISVNLAKRGYIGLSADYFIKAFRIWPGGIVQLPSLWKSILKFNYYILLEIMRRIKKSISVCTGKLSDLLKRSYFVRPVSDALKGCDTVLELGAGKHSYLRETGMPLNITAIDIDQKSIDIAKNANVYDNYIRADVRTIGTLFSEGSFDCVAAFDLIEHLTKEDGLTLLRDIERIARKRMIIYTPNGFLFQGALDGNEFQRHLSGWDYGEMKELGFEVSGINGWKKLRGPLSLPRIRPYFFGALISNITWIFLKLFRLDRYCFSILCIKNKTE